MHLKNEIICCSAVITAAAVEVVERMGYYVTSIYPSSILKPLVTHTFCMYKMRMCFPGLLGEFKPANRNTKCNSIEKFLSKTQKRAVLRKIHYTIAKWYVATHLKFREAPSRVEPNLILVVLTSST